MTIWVTSDHHFGHENKEGHGIIQLDGRPFKSMNEMECVLVYQWNDTVGKQDVVWHLGDFSFENKDKTRDIFRQLRGRKHLILGNHDRGRSLKWWRDVGFDTVIDHPVMIDHRYILSHEPIVELRGTGLVNIHGHIHAGMKSEYLERDGYFNVGVDLNDYRPWNYLNIAYKFVGYGA